MCHSMSKTLESFKIKNTTTLLIPLFNGCHGGRCCFILNDYGLIQTLQNAAIRVFVTQTLVMPHL